VSARKKSGSPKQRPAGRAAARPAPGRSTRPSPAATARREKGVPAAKHSTGGRPMANVRPLRDRVLVRRIEEAEQKIGGIIIPDSAKEKPLQAQVIAVGSGRILESGEKMPLDLKAGDKVLIGKWSGTEVKVDGEDLLILKEDEILGVLS
jgi:chaperonin GroES